jgi:hypothetical protein
MALKRTIDTSGVRTGPLRDSTKVDDCGQRRLAGSVGNHDGGEAEGNGGSGDSEGGRGSEEDGNEDSKHGEEDSENSGGASDSSYTSVVVGPDRFPSFICI